MSDFRIEELSIYIESAEFRVKNHKNETSLESTNGKFGEIRLKFVRVEVVYTTCTQTTNINHNRKVFRVHNIAIFNPFKIKQFNFNFLYRRILAVTERIGRNYIEITEKSEKSENSRNLKRFNKVFQ